MLFEVSGRLTSDREVYNLAINGLKLDFYKVNRHLSNCHDRTVATLHLLQEWCINFDRKEAFNRLLDVFRKVGMSAYTNILTSNGTVSMNGQISRVSTG